MSSQDYTEIFASAYPQDLEPIAELLISKGITCEIETGGGAFNPNLAFSRAADSVRLMVLFYEFDIAKALLVEHGYLADQDEDAGMREMLGGLDDDELLEIVADARRQPADQVAMARKLLTERGASVTDEAVDAIVDEIVIEERKPKRINVFGKAFLLLTCFMLPAFGSTAALIILLFSSSDARGESYWLFSRLDRVLAGTLFVITVIYWLGFSLYRSRMMIGIWEIPYW